MANEDSRKSYLKEQMSANRFASGIVRQNQKLKAHNRALMAAIKKRMSR